MSGHESDADMARLLRFLRNSEAEAEPAARAGMLLLKTSGRAPMACPRQVLVRAMAEGMVVRAGARLRLAARAGNDRSADVPPGRPAFNDSESPLAVLARLRGTDGGGFLSAAEFRAGERLRADFTRGALMPRLGAAWERPVSGGRRHDGGLDLSESALAARIRFSGAIDAVGPELSGVLTDLCCFLKGLAAIEAERRLPARSAKVLVKAGLGILARHYEPAPRSPRRAHHWGADDFRPRIGREG